ncbi:MAG: GWxTD domain-containing protein, partial [Balneolaceae bacterium]|nr:GWxTD domain-containing protein [Balneolaceae bacterium]
MLLFISRTLIAIATTVFFTAGPLAGQNLFDEGREAAASGDTLKALDIWMRAHSELDAPETRIGIAFIKLATEAELTDRYEMASRLYFWGLEARDLEANREALEGEVRRIDPLLSDEQSAEWRKLLNNADPELFERITGFWQSVDPTPLSSYNERLIEHWERIAYAEAHYPKSRKEFLKTGDRGAIYIRYGRPNRIHKGLLQFNSSMARAWISEIVVRATNSPNAASSLSPLIEYKIRQMKDFYTAPRYEIWIYDHPKSETENLIYIFGTNAQTGEMMGLLDSAEDMIPRGAFSMYDRGETATRQVNPNPVIDNIRPGVIYQLMYYDQLATVDHYFGERFERIRSQVVTQGAPSVGSGKSIAYQHRNEMEKMQRSAPEEQSTYEQGMVDIPLKVYQYRLLDNANKPYLATIMQSRPQKAFRIDFFANYPQASTASADNSLNMNSVDQNRLDNYTLVHGLRLYNQEWDLLTQGRFDPAIVTGADKPSVSVFNVPHVGEQVIQVFAAELHNYDDESSYGYGASPFPNYLRGTGEVQKRQPAERLNTSFASLEMGDLVIGYEKREPISENDLFP